MSPRTATVARLERILAMVPWLLDNPGVTLDEVAGRFDTTPADVARDLDVLGYCGLPGYGGGDLIEATVVGDRVSVRMADFFARPLRLSLREAVTLLLAARAVGTVQGLTRPDALARAVTKLERLLDVERGAGDMRLAIDLHAPGDEHLPVLRDALDRRRVIRMVYRSASKAETTERDVEPWSVVAEGGAWYLQGYCRSAQDQRDFRLDRIQTLSVTDEPAPPAPRAPRPVAYQPQADDEVVVLELASDAWWVLDRAVVDDVAEAGVWRRVTLRTRDLEWVARLVLRLGDSARVVEPEALGGRVRELARDLLGRYDEKLAET